MVQVLPPQCGKVGAFWKIFYRCSASYISAAPYILFSVLLTGSHTPVVLDTEFEDAAA